MVATSGEAGGEGKVEAMLKQSNIRKSVHLKKKETAAKSQYLQSKT